MKLANTSHRTQGSQDNLGGSHIDPQPGILLHTRALRRAREDVAQEAMRVDVHRRMLPCPKCGEVYRRKRVAFVAEDGTCVQAAICERRQREMES